MLTPEPMAATLLVVLDEDLAQATEVLGRLGRMQILPIEQLTGEEGDLAWPEGEQLATLYAGLSQRVQRLLGTLGLSARRPFAAGLRIAPRETAEQITGDLVEIERTVGRNTLREANLQEEVRGLEASARQLEALAPLPIDLAALRGLEFVHFQAALVPERNLSRLRGSLAGVPNVIVPVTEQDGYTLILAFTSKEHEPLLQQALRSAYARAGEIPREFSGTPQQALEQLRRRQAELQREAEQVRAGRVEAASQYGQALQQMENWLALNGAAVQAWRHTGATERTRLFYGWVPAREAPAFQAQLQERLAGRVIVQQAPAVDPKATESMPPTAVRQPALLRPLRTLVTTFGTPNYREIDPTLFAGPLFILMFGIMFGDVGQGLILAAAGWLLVRGYLLRGNRNFGWILLASGVSATVFGLLYGTVFLSESLLPALWVRPLEQPEFLITVTLAFGVGVLLLAVGLNLADARRRGDSEAFLLGRFGLAGLWLYAGILLAGFSFLTNRRLGALAVLGLLGAPLILLLLRQPLWRLAQGRSLREAWPGGTALIRSGVEVFDTAVRYVGNTVSFVRLAAFAIAHVGIGVVVFTLAELVTNPLAVALIIVGGNVFVLGLEGLVVFIQALRLNYYEFFTKFYVDAGTRFEPFVLPGDGPGQDVGRSR